MKTIIAIFLIMNIQLHATINDECYYIKPAEMGEKCLAGREGDSLGRFIYSLIREEHPSSFVDYMFTSMAKERYQKECKMAIKYDNKIKQEYKEYYILNCMEALYDARKTIKKIRRRGY